MTSLRFKTAVQKNEAKLSSFVQFESCLCFNCLTSYVLTVLEPSHLHCDVIAALFSDNAWFSKWEIIDTMF